MLFQYIQYIIQNLSFSHDVFIIVSRSILMFKISRNLICLSKLFQ
ncbi:hypothetical protein pb186bvf_005124 [Paramecium bursaria]